MAEVENLHVSYNDVHNIIKDTAGAIVREFQPDLLLAIGGGGFFPARVLRTFIRAQGSHKAIQIQAIGLSLYEPVEGTTAQQIGTEVIRTQWLEDAGKNLVGKKILIIDEVDDTRKTLQYAVSELKKDIAAELVTRPEHEAAVLATQTAFGIFVVHNKKKAKIGQLTDDVKYFPGMEVDDVWLDYPWEVLDIEEHDRLVAADKARRKARAGQQASS
ncbi:PRTase-like protein [Schizophyllum commune H4-8]|uniref:PRTase-like protein n=1 Tax=Schizophyllum commune (strain H4-8 / FGSC 9210) TaxID=578458 RepID=UPI0021601E8C|nr:PRTase-like protein [Schizophyllum commune H4-8]KAI5889648.1 PRTase-like protein [Schizophyllum commune H4-8]